jgi:hypothetical protein
LADGGDESAAQYRADVQAEKRFEIFECSPPDAHFDDRRKPLVKQLVEAHDGSARLSPIVALLQLEIQEPPRFPERTADGSVQVLQRPRLRVAPRINPDSKSGFDSLAL